MTNLTPIDRSSAKSTLYHILFGLILITWLSPYTSPYVLPTDLQPLALIVTGIALILLKISSYPLHLPTNCTFYLYILCFAQAIFHFPDVLILSDTPTTTMTYFILVRELSIVMGMILVAIFTNEILSWKYTKAIFLLILLVWLAEGISQMYFKTNILSELTSRTSTSNHRGVVSLSTEPSIYGLHVLLFIPLSYMLFGERSKWHIGATIIVLLQVFFISKSMTAILGASLFLTTMVLSNSRYLFLLAMPAAAAISSVYLTNYSRNYELIKSLFNEPDKIMALHTVRGRIADILYPFISLYANLPFISGNSIADEALLFSLQNKYVTDFVGNYKVSHNIMSGFGRLIYGYGILGLLIVLRLLVLCLKQKEQRSYIVLILWCGLNALSFGNPLLCLLVFKVASQSKVFEPRQSPKSCQNAIAPILNSTSV